MRISFYNENTAKNALLISVNSVEFYFSYNTLVGVRYIDDNNQRVLAVIQNYWQGTTGKHLNWIDGGDKKSRLNREDFEYIAKCAMKKANISELPTINII